MDDLDTIEDLSGAVSGQLINAAEIHDDGLHFKLSSGAVIVIAGYMAVSLYRPERLN